MTRSLRGLRLGLLLLLATAGVTRADEPEWADAWARVDGVAVLRTAVAVEVRRGAPLAHAVERQVLLTLMKVNLEREGVRPDALSREALDAALEDARRGLRAAGRDLADVLSRLALTEAEFAETLRIPAAFRGHVRAGIDEAALRALYEEEALRLSGQVRARHVLVSIGPQRDEAAARARAEELLTGLGAEPTEEAFAALAAHSDDPMAALTGGDLDWFRYGPSRSVPSPVMDAAFARGRAGLVPEPVRSSQGFHLVWVTGARRPASATVEALRPRREGLREQRRSAELLAAWRERSRVEYAPDAPRLAGSPADVR